MWEKYYLALLHKIWFTHKSLHILFWKQQNYKDFYEHFSISDLWAFSFSQSKKEQIMKNREEFSLDDIIKVCEKKQIQIFTIHDKNFPEKLKNIFNVPFCIYVIWDISGNHIAFVGSRKMTNYGKKAIEKILPPVWKYFSIISGWAFGCDSYAHKVSLEHNIRTISVFWTGIDLVYPVGNKALYEKIVSSWWGLLSSFPLWTPGSKFTFPIRNEIVAGLSQGVVVVEAMEKSGSLITANLALDLWVDVFSIPRDIFSLTSAGCNRLIAKGQAKILLEPQDILEEYNIISTASKKSRKPLKFADKIEKSIYDNLLLWSKTLDFLASDLSLDISILTTKVMILELSGIITKNDTWKYEIC